MTDRMRCHVIGSDPEVTSFDQKSPGGGCRRHISSFRYTAVWTFLAFEMSSQLGTMKHRVGGTQGDASWDPSFLSS